MRVLGYIVVGCLILAALKVAAVVMLATIALIVLIGAIKAPAETLAWIVGFALLGMAQAYPLAGLVVVGMLIFAASADGLR